jgi:hypothetical protein
VTASTIILRLHKPQPRTRLLAGPRCLGEQLPRRTAAVVVALPWVAGGLRAAAFLVASSILITFNYEHRSSQQPLPQPLPASRRPPRLALGFGGGRHWPIGQTADPR